MLCKVSVVRSVKIEAVNHMSSRERPVGVSIVAGYEPPPEAKALEVLEAHSGTSIGGYPHVILFSVM